MLEEVIIVAGGDPNLWPPLEKETSSLGYLGVDRGALYLLEKGILPEAAIGDFDSLNEAEQKTLKDKVTNIYSLPSEKDDTDTEAGLVYATKHFPHSHFTVIGATGGRIDHFLANVYLPLDPRLSPFAEQIVIRDQQNTVTYYHPGSHCIQKEQDKKYLAFICLTSVTKLTIMDAKYQLSAVDVPASKAFVSNEFEHETVHFSFQSGMVAVIQSKD